MINLFFQNGGEDPNNSTAFFNGLVDEGMQQQEEDINTPEETVSVDDSEDEFIRSLTEYADESQNKDLQEQINELKKEIGLRQAERETDTRISDLEDQLAMANFYQTPEGEDALLSAYEPAQPSVETGMPKYSAGDTPLTLTGNSIAATHNNPGNLKFAGWMQKYGAQKGKKGTDGGSFAKFPTVETGLMVRKILLKTKYANEDINTGLKRYSNNGYGVEIYPELKGKKFNQLTEAEFDELTRRQIKREDVGVAKQLGVMKMGGYVGSFEAGRLVTKPNPKKKYKC